MSLAAFLIRIFPATLFVYAVGLPLISYGEDGPMNLEQTTQAHHGDYFAVYSDNEGEVDRSGVVRFSLTGDKLSISGATLFTAEGDERLKILDVIPASGSGAWVLASQYSSVDGMNAMNMLLSVARLASNKKRHGGGEVLTQDKLDAHLGHHQPTRLVLYHVNDSGKASAPILLRKWAHDYNEGLWLAPAPNGGVRYTYKEGDRYFLAQRKADGSIDPSFNDGKPVSLGPEQVKGKQFVWTGTPTNLVESPDGKLSVGFQYDFKTSSKFWKGGVYLHYPESGQMTPASTSISARNPFDSSPSIVLGPDNKFAYVLHKHKDAKHVNFWRHELGQEEWDQSYRVHCFDWKCPNVKEGVETLAPKLKLLPQGFHLGGVYDDKDYHMVNIGLDGEFTSDATIPLVIECGRVFGSL